ncbi:MAG TPA: hypothetical protein VFB92_18990 [Vicinamibacterales bacterium]|nr:hypothetical protein [Vicinamibacterales bacterium]
MSVVSLAAVARGPRADGMAASLRFDAAEKRLIRAGADDDGDG